MSIVVDGSGDARMREYSKLAADLEQQELEAANGVASPQAYGQLLAIYLLQNDLPNAKFLWKRIPQEIKQSHTELGNIWKVGQGLWFKDFPAIYNGLAQEWPDDIKPIMQELGERTRRRALMLVAKAYSSISLDDASSFLGIPKLELADVVCPLGWSVDAANGMVLPKHTVVRHEDSTPSEEQLAKLTDFVAFLEN
ncbi:COP9 signalosome complex subunit 8-like [Dermacentor silvarum]|uniref:COP9 signalosome complex subunit 8-like n=1 Tax=Dermacentor silvarum TaxID=543639 RepID=UPI00189BC6A3|nr:COP9 signalosome complex subunit 8-like [Dermacentor silvarum]